MIKMTKKDKLIGFFIEFCFSIGIFAFFTSCLKDLFVPVCYLLGYIHCIIIRMISNYLDLKYEVKGVD